MIDHVQNRVGIPTLAAILRSWPGRSWRTETRRPACGTIIGRSLALQKHASRPVALAGDPASQQIVDDRLQPIVIKALAQRFVERHAQPVVNMLDRGHAGGHELSPQGAGSRHRPHAVWPFRPAPRRRFRDAPWRAAQFGIGFERGQLASQFGQRRFASPRLGFRLAHACACFLSALAAPLAWTALAAGPTFFGR